MRTLAILFSVLALHASLQAQTISLALDLSIVEIGELATVEVRVDDAVADLRGYSLDVYFDPSRVAAQSIFEGEVLLPHSPTFFYWEERDDEWGHCLHIDNAILGGTLGGNGPGALCYILLRGQSCGLETLRIDHATLRDLDNQPLAVTTGPALTHQICQVPPLFITTLGDGAIRLSWTPALNVIAYHLWSRERWYQPWQYRGATTDTSWVDPETPFLGMRLYHMTLLHN